MYNCFHYKLYNMFLHILVLFAILAYILQYTGLNYEFFTNNFSIHYYLTLGRFAEGLPNAVSGFYIASKNFTSILKTKARMTIINSLIILSFITKLKVFSNIKTFKYGGIRLNIAAICIFFIFYLFPFSVIKNKFLINIIKQLTSYTGGIYFIHNLIGRGYILSKILSILTIERHSLLECIIVFIISYIICFYGTRLFGRTKFRHLFA